MEISKALPEEFLRSFAIDAFSSEILAEAQLIQGRSEALRQQWDADKNMEITFGSAENISMYNCYPYLFLQAFPAIPLEKLRDFALAGNLFANAAFLIDRILDLSLQAHRSARFMLLVIAFQTEGLSLLHQLFPPLSPFWPRFRSYMTSYFQACMQEKRFVNGEIAWNDFDENVAWELTIGKCGISQAVVAGLASLANDEQHLEALRQSICLYNFAHQMLDDLCDWKEDYLSRSPSLLLCSVLKERPVDPRPEDIKQIARKIHYEGHSSAIIHRAIDALNQSLALVPGDLPWVHLQVKLRERAEGLLNDITKITEANRRRAIRQPRFHLELPQAHTLYEHLVWQGLQFISDQWQKGFVEARQVTRFPYVEGFTGRSELQYADIFQRAVITEILCDVAHTFSFDLRPIIAYETSYLRESRCREGVGGWSYFPDLPELAPDADDLAQIMQVFLLTQQRDDVIEYCEPPLQTLLNDVLRPDGSFETWIVPAQNRTPEQERHALFAEQAWGRTADVDVMSNMLYALALYDEDRFAEVIRAGIKFIERQQREDGSWASTWYHGPFYGTYVTLRLLERVHPTSSTLDRARTFLCASQHEDGSWGMPDANGDPLHTSLALLCWDYLTRLGKLGDAAPAVSRALEYLQKTFEEKERSWPRYEFILMTKHIPYGDKTYGSRTITTSYVVKAATAWHRLQDQLKVVL